LAVAPDGTLWSAERDVMGGVKTTYHGQLRHYAPSGETLADLSGVTWPEVIVLAPDGTLLVSDNGHFLDDPFRVVRLSPDGAVLGALGGPGPGRPPGGFRRASGIATLSDGRTVVADGIFDCLQVYAPDGTPAGVWGAPLVRPEVMHVDPAGTLRMVERGDPRIHRVGPDGSVTVIGTPPDYRAAGDLGLRTSAFGPDGRAYVVTATTGRLRRHAPDGAVEADFVLGGVSADTTTTIASLAVDGAGRMFVARSRGQEIVRLGPDGRRETAWQGAAPGMLALGPSGALYLADERLGRVHRYSPDGESLGIVLDQESVNGESIRTTSLAVGPNDRVATVDRAGNRLLVVDPGEPRAWPLAAESLGLGKDDRLGVVAFDPAGRLLVSVEGANVVLRLTLEG
jgi:sugar lactone lactonase YvrE